MVKSKTNNNQVFGEIDGYPEGEYFDNISYHREKYKLAHKGAL